MLVARYSGITAERARVAAELALEQKIDPVEAINQGLIVGMGIIGDKYAVREIYLPQVLVAAHAMYEGLDVLTPAIPKKSLEDSRTALTAVVEGDVHDIGKNIVKTMLTAGGYIVNDLGNDVPPAQISNTAKETGVDAVCISTLMTPTMANMQAAVKLMFDNGYRDKCVVTIGGPPTSVEFAKEIGADHRDDDAQACVKYVTSKLNEMKRR
jgi:methylmalonyl-CoA mutase cobalamin-binding domain/chain